MKVATLILFFVAACSKAPAPVPSMPAAPVATSDPLDEKLRHCPLTVPGAQAEVHDVDGGVELLVHVDAAELDELTKRVHHIEEFTAKHGQVEGRHGTGKGGGKMQNCPVVTQNTAVEGTAIEGGFRILVRPVDAGDVDSLRAETRRRLAALGKS